MSLQGDNLRALASGLSVEQSQTPSTYLSHMCDAYFLNKLWCTDEVWNKYRNASK